MKNQFVVIGFWEYDPLPSTQLKDENREARLCHGMLVEGDEVGVVERDGAAVVGALELDKLCVGTTVVATVPTRTRTWRPCTSKPLHSLRLLLPTQQEPLPHPHGVFTLSRCRGEGRDSSGRLPFVT
jgi:hypothetical protein